MDKLIQVEQDILKAFHDYFYNEGKKPNFKDFELENKGKKNAMNEYAFILVKLKDNGFLTFIESEVFTEGGIRDEKYLNTVAIIHTDKIKPTNKLKMYF